MNADNIVIKRNGNGDYAWVITLFSDLTEEEPDKVIDTLHVYDDKLREAFLRRSD